MGKKAVNRFHSMRVFYPPRKFYRTVLGLAFFALGELQGCAGTMVRDADSGADAASAGKVETLDVAVIGAGLSGLTAAFRLGAIAPPLHGKPALRIQVFEARPRLGGRVFTVMMNGQPVELGGQTFEDGGSASEIRSLVSELKLDTTVFRRPNRTSYGHHGEGIEPSLIQIYRDVMPQLPRIATAEAEEKVADLLEDLARSQTSLEPVIELFFTKLQQEAAGNLSRVKAYEILKNYSRARVMLYEGVPPAQLASTYATGSFLYMFLRTEKDYQKWLAQGSPADQEGSFTGTSVAGGKDRKSVV